jgi:hypothetical protein
MLLFLFKKVEKLKKADTLQRRLQTNEQTHE